MESNRLDRAVPRLDRSIPEGLGSFMVLARRIWAALWFEPEEPSMRSKVNPNNLGSYWFEPEGASVGPQHWPKPFGSYFNYYVNEPECWGFPSVWSRKIRSNELWSILTEGWGPKTFWRTKYNSMRSPWPHSTLTLTYENFCTLTQPRHMIYCVWSQPLINTEIRWFDKISYIWRYDIPNSTRVVYICCEPNADV